MQNFVAIFRQLGPPSVRVSCSDSPAQSQMLLRNLLRVLERYFHLPVDPEAVIDKLTSIT